MSKRFAPEQEREICELYFEGQLGSIKLARQFQCSPSTVKYLIKKNGFKLRSFSEARKDQFGAKHPNWKGGRSPHRDGYIYILKRNHPNADRWGRIFEHRLIMEKHLGRFLKKEEIVHHVNNIRNDNRIENLMLFSGHSKHGSWHQGKKRETKLLQKDFCANL